MSNNEQLLAMKNLGLGIGKDRLLAKKVLAKTSSTFYCNTYIAFDKMSLESNQSFVELKLTWPIMVEYC